MEDKEFMIDAVRNFFEQDDWNCSFDEENSCFAGGIDLGENFKIRTIQFIIFAHEDHLVCYHYCDINARESDINAVGEFLHRANYGLNRGCFEIDYNDGEIRYKHRISLAEIKDDTYNTMRAMMFIGADMFCTYGDGLLAVAFGLKSPADAIADCEEN